MRLVIGGLLALWPALAAAQAVTLTPLGSIAGPADLVEVDGTRLYVAGGKTLTIFDVADPAAPRRVASYDFPELIWGVTVAGPAVFVAADTHGLAILDVTNPAAPVSRGQIRTPGQAKNVALSGTRAFVADHIQGIDVIDLAVPSKPVLRTSMFVEGFAKDVVTRGTMLYTLDQPNGLNVFDVSTAGASDPIGTARLANPIPLRAQLDVTDAESPRLAVVSGGGPLQIFDVSDPRAIRYVTTYRTPGAAQRLQLQGARAYVADGPAGLQVIDLAAPAAPTIAGGMKLAGPARDVAVSGDRVFVVAGANQVVILQTGTGPR